MTDFSENVNNRFTLGFVTKKVKICDRIRINSESSTKKPGYISIPGFGF
jgi:hypothetical protein